MTKVDGTQEALVELQLGEGRGNHLVAGPTHKAIDSLTETYDNSADEWWKSCAMRALRTKAASGQIFDAFDLTEMGVPDPMHPNHWGSLFRVAANAGLITEAGFHQSRRPGRAGGVCRLWKGAA